MSYDTERKENDLPSDLQISLQDKSVTFRHVRCGEHGEEKCGRICDDSFDTMPVHRHYLSYPTLPVGVFTGAYAQVSGPSRDARHLEFHSLRPASRGERTYRRPREQKSVPHSV